jgi:predicted HTH domain antitoxin
MSFVMSAVPEDLEPIERYLLMLLYSSDSSEKFAQPLKGKTWLQKEMFLLSQLIPELESETEYDPHLMGSYSEIVDEVAYQFEVSGYTERVGDSIKLSLDGKKLAEQTWKGASDQEKAFVTDVKTLLNDLSQWELFGLIYFEFPKTAINSEKLAEVEARRVDIAFGLLAKGKVSVEKAAEMAKKPLPSFLHILKAKKIKMPEIESRGIMQDRSLVEEIRASRKDSRNRRLVPWETIKNNP